ncbi:MAG: 1-acyl-sn-glycerol-3-phosphate acyltransferase [Ignavibacteria bacterium]|nr:1-acyl-sn-glycerol-3-phosphate acyltransferase [Ignavibacteria bacterium]
MQPGLSNKIRSIIIWIRSALLIIGWVPLLAVIRLMDRSETRIKTGFWFRRLGRALTRANPFWTVAFSGSDRLPESRAYVVVSNHQSLADIPIISRVHWEMKWVAKEELFRLPVLGWLLKMAGDIPVDRGNRRSGGVMLLKAREYLEKGCPVMFFPEGTRSKDGTVGAFSPAPFHLAIRTGVPVLPIAIEGSHQCLPKRSWVFGEPATIHLRVLPPVPTEGLTPADAENLCAQIRERIAGQVREWSDRTG